MDSVLLSSIDLLPGEIKGLFNYQMEQTGYSADEILIQSLFFHYPEIFGRLNLNLHYFVYLHSSDLERLTTIQEYLPLDYGTIIRELVKNDNDDTYLPISTFPTPLELLPHLKTSREFTDFPVSRQYMVLLQKLIFRYHLLIQPQLIMNSSLDYHRFQFFLSSSEAKCMLHLIPRYVYNNRKYDYYVKQQIFIKYILLKQWCY